MMKKNTIVLYCYSMMLAGILFSSCSGNSSKEKDLLKKDTVQPTIKATVKKTETPEPDIKYQRPPIINIVDTVTPKRIIIYCKDSAASFERISLKRGKIYGTTLAEYIKKNNLKVTGAPIAWYTKRKASWFFEAGIPVNKKGAKSIPGVQVRELDAGKAVVAHFYGPYDLLSQGYDAIKEWMKENKKRAAGTPYEMYITDPVDKTGKPVDPYKVKTDIIFPIR